MTDRYAGMELEPALLEVLAGGLRLSATTIRQRLIGGGFARADELSHERVYRTLRTMENMKGTVERRYPPGEVLWARV